ncbi:MAG: polysaccharide biosynthesis tyrosine autokinase [Myxococcota bacterium]
MKKRKNARLTARLLGLPEDTTVFDDAQIEQAADMLTLMLTATQQRESRIINIHVQHGDRALAVDLANAHIDTFHEYSKGARVEDTREISVFLDEELQRSARRLSDAETKLLDFKRDNDLLSVSLEDKQNILATDIAQYSRALRDAHIDRMKLAGLRARVSALKDEDIMESPIFGLIEGGAVVDALKEQYARQKHTMAELSQELGPLHPGYKSQQTKVDELLAAIRSEAKRVARELDVRHQAALDNERRFTGEVDRLKQEAFELAPKTVAYRQLLREQQSAEEQYNLLLSRSRVSELTEKNKSTNVSRHTRARIAIMVHPRMSRNVGIAGVLSLVLALGLAFLLDIMDRTVKSPEDIERLVGAPVLGTIPRVDDDELDSGDGDGQRDRDLYVLANNDSPVAEHCRSIRTNILFSSANRPMKTITISSPQKSEGKTTTAIYMGTIMAQSSQRVLLVDTDMRRPRLHKSLLGDKTPERGLSHLLVGDEVSDDQLDSVILTTTIPQLDLLPCGQRPPNPAELLLTDRFKDILVKLEERYDRVLLDSPPLILLNDAVVLSRLSDGVVMVAKAGSTSIDDLGRSARMIRDIDAPILGVILNNVSRSSDSFYHNYYYNSDDGPQDDDKVA